MSKSAVKAIPDGMHSLTPHLVCAGATQAIEWSIATHIRDVSPQEMQQAIQQMGS